MRTTAKAEVLKPEGRLDLTLEPFLRSREEAQLIRLLQSVPAQRKFAVFFERHGCLRCGARNVPHACSGLCQKCRGWAYNEMKKILEELGTA